MTKNLKFNTKTSLRPKKSVEGLIDLLKSLKVQEKMLNQLKNN